jgi:prophage regulatory protein
MMSNSQLIRITEVSKKTTLAKSTIWLKIAQGKFPAPAKLSPAISVWKETDINDWINQFFGSSNSEAQP